MDIRTNHTEESASADSPQDNWRVKRPVSANVKVSSGMNVYNRKTMLRTPIFRPLWLPTAIISALLLTTIGLMVSMSWRNMHRLQPLQEHLTQLSRLQQARLELDEMLVPVLGDNADVDHEKIQLIDRQINGILQLNANLQQSTPVLLRSALQALNKISLNPRENLIACLTDIRRVLSLETRAHEKLVNKVRHDTELEFKIATSILIVLPLLAFGILFLLRQKIFEPLNELATLMTLLARQDFKPAASSSVGPILKPLFDNYNHLVSRLSKLEQENRARQETLQNRVRTATHALLEQQRELAAAERFAAVGELAAGLAHELRNPLAAMQMALNNLREEIQDADYGARLTLIVNELNRVTALLNGSLSQTRQEPEHSMELSVGNAVNELATLVSYQIGKNIQLQQQIPQELKCRLPAGRLHQAILNLVLNAAQAIGESNKGSIIIEAERRNDQVILSVRDDGPGFPQTMLDNGIRPFSTGRVGGTGLGLAIVQRFTRDLGGEIELSNQQPRGACVKLTLPCEP
jgi:two-component system NtrC family sensor kinase